MKDIDKVNSQKVSVVTVCLNHKEGLDRTLASVVAQSWREMEHIVIDGGSTDGSVKSLEEHRTDKPYVFVSEPDSGLYDAMNKGWRMAEGNLVVFMNAGDTFASETVVETFAKARGSESWRWGYGCVRIFDASSQPIRIVSFVPFRLDRLALGLSVVPHQATVMERELLEELEGFKTEVGVAADQELLLRAALLSQPRLWGEFFADFEGGGVGSSRGWSSYVRDMGRFRANLGLYVGGGRMRDKLVTVALTVYKLGEAGQDKVRQRKGLLGKALFDTR
jgi:glycosyltransferase involved in cell wall biosynthesis